MEQPRTATAQGVSSLTIVTLEEMHLGMVDEMSFPNHVAICHAQKKRDGSTNADSDSGGIRQRPGDAVYG
ncbi:hypothetical protein GJ744_012345 [Endocarpon pusillum]|uniref:Uncharacterized protein n=1 Tax=Endocarpon pusillum TaxID=364733 RepID=A0A8H7ABB5_9EURO|nr:hypothetical protein GJ744_012345 [Endocarpon pusillum]